ncbi:capsid protein [Bacillus cereus]|uniref:Capsid protein n=1 Tax=Bacillus cereus TaxID=1396 RepID=A0A9X9AB54_BACCE|nr:capsid protein [Bacillus cereus]
MPVILDSRDLATIDKEMAVESKVWEVLKEGAKSISDSDFVSVNEVRINKMTGFTNAKYARNADNKRSKIDVSKETVKLTQERWMGYDLDSRDESENMAYAVGNVIQEHNRLVTIPEKDIYAIKMLLENAGKLVPEKVDTTNSLDVFDAAEEYMTDEEVSGPFVMFASSSYYKALKNNDKVSKTFTTNEVNISGINRKVAQLDNDIPIIRVPAARLAVDEKKKINFILVPLSVAAPIEKYNDVTLIPAETDRDGYRDTIKGLDYYDLIVFENAKKAIYVSYEEAAPGTKTKSIK